MVFNLGTIALQTGNANQSFTAPANGYLNLNKTLARVTTKLDCSTGLPVVGVYKGSTKLATMGTTHTATAGSITGIADHDAVGTGYVFTGDPSTSAEEIAYPRPTGERGYDSCPAVKITAGDIIKFNVDTACTDASTAAGAVEIFADFEWAV